MPCWLRVPAHGGQPNASGKHLATNHKGNSPTLQDAGVQQITISDHRGAIRSSQLAGTETGTPVSLFLHSGLPGTIPQQSVLPPHTMRTPAAFSPQLKSPVPHTSDGPSPASFVLKVSLPLLATGPRSNPESSSSLQPHAGKRQLLLKAAAGLCHSLPTYLQHLPAVGGDATTPTTNQAPFPAAAGQSRGSKWTKRRWLGYDPKLDNGGEQAEEVGQ